MDQNTYELNRHLDDLERSESPAAISEANARINRQRRIVSIYANQLLAGQGLQVGNRVTERGSILGECLHDHRIKSAMQVWREGDKLPILDVIHRSAAVICASVLGWDLVELGLVSTRFSKLPTQEEAESYEMPLDALIDSHLRRSVGTATSILQAEINGEIEEFMARGHTMLEADTKAQRLRSAALAKAELAAVSARVKASRVPAAA